MFVFQRNGISDMLLEVAIGDGQPNFPTVMFEVLAQGFGDGENGFFPRGLVIAG